MTRAGCLLSARLVPKCRVPKTRARV